MPRSIDKKLLASLAIAVSVLGATAQAATPIWDNTVSNCTALNCSSLTIPGTVSNVVGASTDRWTIKVFALAGECLRLDETAMFAGDDEMVVVSPDGVIYRNDDFGGTLRPRVVINTTPTRGWYNVSIAHYAGAPAPEHDFILSYGRYVANTANNCATPTVAQAIPQATQLKPQQQNSQQAPAGAPTAEE